MRNFFKILTSTFRGIRTYVQESSTKTNIGMDLKTILFSNIYPKRIVNMEFDKRTSTFVERSHEEKIEENLGGSDACQVTHPSFIN